MFGFQAAGAAPLVHGAPVGEARDGRPRDPDRQPGPLGGGDGGDDRVARGVAAVTDAQILDAYRLLASNEGVFCEPASAASVAGLLVHGAGAPSASSAC